ncbi:hypothetical protein CY34DRAFT_17378 [Suillus luteus UH-Slu-Lm8-n1]|uniref:SAP domain-containing protein n=1 Tax=Suillus luteus UH-Slu-Lm8-n1 TaxID=930992 RepID=A0A0D0ASK5_9AGAM|nr:hypothetical protein CY34DRAFT_17378 [Suillus luteus UH-Slu-Lm8-n1]
MAEHYKERLNKKLEDKSRKRPGKKRMKPYSRVLTSEEGRMELMELEAEQAEHERQEEASKQKKATEEQGKCDWRAEQERSQVAFTGAIKTKKLDELRDIAAALRLPETGLKAELLQRIVQFFNGQPELKKNQQYEGLFNPSRSRRWHVEIGNNTTESVPQDMPIHQNLMHTPFGTYQPQPIPQPSMSHIDLPSLGRYVPPPIPQFVPAAGNREEFRVGAEVQMYDGRSQPYSGPYQWQYTHNNNYMDHDA